jgi:hypothetical protein
MGRYCGGGVSLGAMIIGCVVYGIQLGWGCVVCGLVCLTSSGLSSGLLFSVGVFGHGFPLCVCSSPRNIGIYIYIYIYDTV